jgi:hypothetical protein
MLSLLNWLSKHSIGSRFREGSVLPLAGDMTLADQIAARKPWTAAANAFGCSIALRCEAPASTSSRAPGMPAASCCAMATGVP